MEKNKYIYSPIRIEAEIKEQQTDCELAEVVFLFAQQDSAGESVLWPTFCKTLKCSNRKSKENLFNLFSFPFTLSFAVLSLFLLFFFTLFLFADHPFSVVAVTQNKRISLIKRTNAKAKETTTKKAQTRNAEMEINFLISIAQRAHRFPIPFDEANWENRIVNLVKVPEKKYWIKHETKAIDGTKQPRTQSKRSTTLKTS